MKRIALVLITLSLICLAGCAKKTGNNFGYFDKVEPAAKVALEKDQDILLILTMIGDDPYSKEFMETVVNTSEFKKEIASKYAVVCVDFGSETFKKSVVDENASKKEKEQAAYYADLLEHNRTVGTKMNLQVTPSLYLLTKEQYYITQLDTSVKIESVSDFEELLEVYEPTITDVHNLLTKTKTGTDEEKITAIDNFYSSTEPNYRNFLKPLVEQVLELDKDNTYGYYSKYLLAQADIEALTYYDTGDIKAASDAFAKAAKNKLLSPEHKQQAYYMAGYTLNMGGSQDYQQMLDYLQAAIDVLPDSQAVTSIIQIRNNLQAYIDSIQQTSEGDQE